MQSRFGHAGILLVALGWGDLAAQQPACTLLTSTDIETITGAKPLEPHPMDMVIPVGPQKGQPMNGCMWGTPDSGMISISVMPVPQGMSRAAAMAKLEEVYARLRAQQWTEETKDYVDGRCSTMTPPPGKKDAPIMSGCIVANHGMVLSATYSSPTVKLPIDKSRELVNKVSSHLQ